MKYSKVCDTYLKFPLQIEIINILMYHIQEVSKYLEILLAHLYFEIMTAYISHKRFGILCISKLLSHLLLCHKLF